MSDPYASITAFEIDLDNGSPDVGCDHKDDSKLSKSERIQRCIDEYDVPGLRKLGREKNGFINNDLRKAVWPLVARIGAPEEEPPEISEEQLENLKCYEQICHDVPRTFFFDIEDSEKTVYRNQLKNLLAQLMIKNPDFSYPQGYDSFCKIFLLVLGQELAFHTLNEVSRTHIAKFLLGRADKVFEQDMDRQFVLFKSILDGQDPELKEFLRATDFHIHMIQSWIATWFSHDLKEYENVVRLFDLFIVSDPFMPLYLSTAILIYKKSGILALEREQGYVINFINRLWSQEKDIPFSKLIYNARCLMAKYPPEPLLDRIPVGVPDRAAQRVSSEMSQESSKEPTVSGTSDRGQPPQIETRSPPESVSQDFKPEELLLIAIAVLVLAYLVKILLTD